MQVRGRGSGSGGGLHVFKKGGKTLICYRT